MGLIKKTWKKTKEIVKEHPVETILIIGGSALGIGGYVLGKKTSVDRMGKYMIRAYNEGVCTANTTIQRDCEEMGKIVFVSEDDIPITKIYTVTNVETKE